MNKCNNAKTISRFPLNASNMTNCGGTNGEKMVLSVVGVPRSYLGQNTFIESKQILDTLENTERHGIEPYPKSCNC